MKGKKKKKRTISPRLVFLPLPPIIQLLFLIHFPSFSRFLFFTPSKSTKYSPLIPEETWSLSKTQIRRSHLSIFSEPCFSFPFFSPLSFLLSSLHIHVIIFSHYIFHFQSHSSSPIWSPIPFPRCNCISFVYPITCVFIPFPDVNFHFYVQGMYILSFLLRKLFVSSAWFLAWMEFAIIAIIALEGVDHRQHFMIWILIGIDAAPGLRTELSDGETFFCHLCMVD